MDSLQENTVEPTVTNGAETPKKQKKKLKTWMLRLLVVAVIMGAIGCLSLAAINRYMISKTRDYILTEEEALALEDVDCILVLGAGVWGDAPSPILRDRLQIGISLYEASVSSKLLMSGDHGREEYDEVNIMKDYAIAQGIPSEDIFMDHAGFSTYESMYRAKEIFQAKKIVIVTQEYHMYRALYDARELGLEAYGVCTDVVYGGQFMRDVREVAARAKDFCFVLFDVKPTYLGDVIPVNGNGDVTNDRGVQK